MSSYIAFLDYDRLKIELNEIYGISADAFELISDYCASVYVLSADDKKYIFKLHRTFDTEIALQSANIMDYLSAQSFPAVPIVHTKKGHLTFPMSFPEGNRIGTLYDFIDGKMGYDLNFEYFAATLGEIMGHMHLLMDRYDKPLMQYGRDHYVGRCINIMKEFNYSPSKIAELDEYASILWSNVTKTKPGFCHGDFNVSNFILSHDGKYYLFDFDCAGISYPINDVFCICNMTATIFDFNITSVKNYIDATRKLSLIRQGYEKHRKLNDLDIAAVYSFIGLSVFWTMGQVNKYRSLLEGHRRWIDEQYFDKRYNWLMRWEKALGLMVK